MHWRLQHRHMILVRQTILNQCIVVAVVQDAPINAGLVVRQLVLGSVKEQVTHVHIINVVADG